MTLGEAVQEYLAALDEVRAVGPGRWLNLKGAARQATVKARQTRLKVAERRLRELAGSNPPALA